MQAARGASLNSSDPPDPVSGSSPDPVPGQVEGLAPRRRFVLLFAAIAAASYVFDVVTKVVAVNTLTGRDPVEIVGHYFSLYLARNPGAAFSTGTSYTLLLTLVAIVAAAVVVWLSRRLASVGWAVGFGFLLGGVLGNLTDRLLRQPGPLRGHVVDFLMFPNFPIFNFADIWINVAAGLIVLQSLRGVRVDGSRHADTGPAGAEDP